VARCQLLGAPDKHTDWTDIRPQNTRCYNKWKSTDLAKCYLRAPWGWFYERPKHV